jgi:DNA-binding transcriptional LysR family regulator
MMGLENLRLLRTLVRTAESGSISAAARPEHGAAYGEPAVATGQLVRVLPQGNMPHANVHVVFPGAPLPARLRAFIDYAVAELPRWIATLNLSDEVMPNGKSRGGGNSDRATANR